MFIKIFIFEANNKLIKKNLNQLFNIFNKKVQAIQHLVTYYNFSINYSSNITPILHFVFNLQLQNRKLILDIFLIILH